MIALARSLAMLLLALFVGSCTPFWATPSPLPAPTVVPPVTAIAAVSPTPSPTSSPCLGVEVAFETIGRGDRLGAPKQYAGKEPRLVVIGNEEETKLLGSIVPSLMEELEGIDYARHYVIAVFQGRKPSGAFGAEIRWICQHDDVVTIYAHFTYPKSGQEQTQLETSPYHLAGVSRVGLEAGEVEFVVVADGAEVVRERHRID